MHVECDGQGMYVRGEYGCYEAFWYSDYGHDHEGYAVGWYVWACFPGCLPDGEPIGPFANLEEAVAQAREWGGFWEQSIPAGGD